MTLPLGFQIRLDRDVKTIDNGRVLLGGSPLRVVRLSPRALELFAGDVLQVRDPASAVVAERLLRGNLAHPVLDPSNQCAQEELTVVVPVRDRYRQLDRALTALRGLKVLVVDDASDDPKAVAAVTARHAVRILQLDHNLGPAGARNAGLAQVRTPYVAFVDSDVRVEADILLGLTAHFADPAVAVVGPYVRARSSGSSPRWFERYEEAVPSLGLGDRPCSVGPGAAVAWLPSACLVARTDAIRAGFDYTMRVGEDVDLVWRLVDSGQRVRYDPNFTAHHDTRATLRAWAGRKFVYGTGGALLARRHPDKIATAVLSPTMATAGLALLMARRSSVPVAAAAALLGLRSLKQGLPVGAVTTPHAARLVLRGLGWSLRQQAALVLRHWWPASLVLATQSRTARRVIATSLVVDAVAAKTERPAVGIGLTVAGRRIDDFAYGAGLWWGAVREGSIRCLAARITKSNDRRLGPWRVTGGREL